MALTQKSTPIRRRRPGIPGTTRIVELCTNVRVAWERDTGQRLTYIARGPEIRGAPQNHGPHGLLDGDSLHLLRFYASVVNEI